ncbi:MAG: lysoplasmalogenase [Ardenticatenaceae bacterium]
MLPPFATLDNSTQQLWLLALWLLWAVLLFGGFFFGKPHAQNSRRMPTWTRISSSFTLVVAAWSWYVFSFDEFALLIAIGMTLGFVGDLFMAELLPLKNNVMGGIAAFGLGHIAYIAGILSIGRQLELNDASTQWNALAIWLLIGVLGWYIVVFRGQTATILHRAALPYALLLATTTGLATALALEASAFVWLAIGAALFLLSDLILAAQLFNGLHFRLISDVVWLTYGPGQMMIVYSVAKIMEIGGLS